MRTQHKQQSQIRKPSFVRTREYPCPDCNLRDDLTSTPDLGVPYRRRRRSPMSFEGGRPLRIRKGRHSRVHDCETCGGKGYLVSGESIDLMENLL